jgi:hypothetical protein
VAPKFSLEADVAARGRYFYADFTQVDEARQWMDLVGRNAASAFICKSNREIQ